jgi:hypothetical protein
MLFHLRSALLVGQQFAISKRAGTQYSCVSFVTVSLYSSIKLLQFLKAESAASFPSHKVKLRHSITELAIDQSPKAEIYVSDFAA